MKVLNYGSLNIDMTFQVDHIVVPGETISATSLKKGAGGKGANQSAALGKAGVQVFHAGKIGHDGQFLLDKLTSYGVDVGLVRVTDDSSGQAIIQLDEQGQNAIVLLGGGNRLIAKKEIDETLMHFTQGDWLVLQNEINNNAYLMEQAYRKGMHICFNPAPYEETVKSLPLHLVDLLVVNEIEGQGLSGIKSTHFEEVAKSLARQYNRAEIIVTVGAAGSYYANKDMVIHQSIVPTNVVDTTGAGDTFIGYFLAAKLRGCSPKESLNISAKASSIAISRPGAMDAIPMADEVF